MFALEIDFHDGISPPETILVRRTNAIIGSSDLAHVVVEGAASSLCELRLIRGLGREFTCVPVRRPGQASVSPPFLEGTYPGEAELKLGELSFNVTALDIDLHLVPDEFPDRAAIRVLRTALTFPSPVFPAVAVLGAKPMFISFPQGVPLLIGRSRKCGLRLDASDVSSEHARVGLDEERCWVEDLGSTNGTFVGSERVSGRRYLEEGETIRVGSEFTLALVMFKEDVGRLNSQDEEYPDPSLVHSYPCIVANNEVVRPGLFPLKTGAKISIGRDPSNDIWINSPHISRTHVELVWDGEAAVNVVDCSSNGTYVGGERLPEGVPTQLRQGLEVLDLCSGVLLAVCYSENDESLFFSPDSAEQLNDLRGSDFVAKEQDQRDLPFEANSGLREEKTDITETNLLGDTKSSLPNVFERMAQRSSNRAQDGRIAASKEEVYGLAGEQGKPDFADGDSIASTTDSVPSGLSEFEQFQLEQRQQGRTERAEFNPDYDLLAEAEFDEELLEESPYSGISRFATMIFIVVLVLVSLFFVMGMFTSGFL